MSNSLAKICDEDLNVLLYRVFLWENIKASQFTNLVQVLLYSRTRTIVCECICLKCYLGVCACNIYSQSLVKPFSHDTIAAP